MDSVEAFTNAKIVQLQVTDARRPPRALDVILTAHPDTMSLTLQSVWSRFKTRFLDVKLQAIKETMYFDFKRKVDFGLFSSVTKPKNDNFRQF